MTYPCESGCGALVSVYGAKWCERCHPQFSQGQSLNEIAFIVVAGKYEPEEGELLENFKFISEPLTLADAERILEENKGYPFARIEYHQPGKIQ